MTERFLSCHCGAVELAVSGIDDLSDAYRCDCSYCARRGAIMMAVPRENVRILQGHDKLSKYQWGTNTAEHFFCMECGIYTHHRRKVNPAQFGINVATIKGFNPRELGPVPWPASSHR